MPFSCALVLLLLGAFAPWTRAASPAVLLLAPYGDRPSDRAWHTTVVSQDGVVYLFGGEVSREVQPPIWQLNDLYAYDAESNYWTQLTPNGANGSAPARRSGHAAAFDDGRRQMYMFGGWNGHVVLDDLFSFDDSAQHWKVLSPSGAAPLARHGHSAVFDTANDRMLVFGGSGNGQYFSDLHAYDPKTNSWQELAPSGDIPAPRDFHTAVFDPRSSKMYVFGGWAGKRKTGGLYSYDVVSNTWAKLTGEDPVTDHAAAMDVEGRTMYIHGGAGPDGNPRADLLAYDVDSGSWSRVSASGVKPARVSHSASFDAKTNNLYIFCGIRSRSLDSVRTTDTLFRFSGLRAAGQLSSRGLAHSAKEVVLLVAGAIFALLIGLLSSRTIMQVSRWKARSSNPAWAAISLQQLNDLREAARELLGEQYVSATMYDISKLLIQPACQREGKPYAHIVNGSSLLPVSVFISHAWAENFDEFVDSVNNAFRLWTVKPNIWICALALVQSEDPKIIEQQVGLSANPRRAPFTKALAKADKVLIVRNRAVDIYSRIWCCWELAAAHELGFTEKPGAVLVAGPAAFSSDVDPDIAKAQAANPDDKARILHYLSRRGSCDAVNSQLAQVKNHVAQSTCLSAL